MLARSLISDTNSFSAGLECSGSSALPAVRGSVRTVLQTTGVPRHVALSTTLFMVVLSSSPMTISDDGRAHSFPKSMPPLAASGRAAPCASSASTTAS